MRQWKKLLLSQTHAISPIKLDLKASLAAALCSSLGSAVAWLPPSSSPPSYSLSFSTLCIFPLLHPSHSKGFNFLHFSFLAVVLAFLELCLNFPELVSSLDFHGPFSFFVATFHYTSSTTSLNYLASVLLLMCWVAVKVQYLVGLWECSLLGWLAFI